MAKFNKEFTHKKKQLNHEDKKNKTCYLIGQTRL